MSFQFAFSKDKLQACVPGNNKITDWYDVICQVLPEYQIITWQRVSQWLAQMGHESGDFRVLTENLNYSADALQRVWPRHFPTADIATQYARQPERIANSAYANRMGNGPESSGDGWRFRGRGLVQVTGRSNYTDASRALYGDEQILLKEPHILSEPDGAIRSACWYWNSRKINGVADREDTEAVTKLINGGTHGLADRQARYARAAAVLKG